MFTINGRLRQRDSAGESGKERERDDMKMLFTGVAQ